MTSWPSTLVYFIVFLLTAIFSSILTVSDYNGERNAVKTRKDEKEWHESSILQFLGISLHLPHLTQVEEDHVLTKPIE